MRRAGPRGPEDVLAVLSTGGGAGADDDAAQPSGTIPAAGPPWAASLRRRPGPSPAERRRRCAGERRDAAGEPTVSVRDLHTVVRVLRHGTPPHQGDRVCRQVDRIEARDVPHRGVVVVRHRVTAIWRAETGHVRQVHAPGIVVEGPDTPPVHLLLVTEWLDSVSLHLSWPWLHGDVHCSLRQAYRLADADGRSCPLIDSRVLPLAGRMNEVTFFDTHSLAGPQTLALRLRSQLAMPIDIPFQG